MNIDAAQFRKIVRAIFETDEGVLLSSTGAEAILEIAALAIGADDREDEDEVALFETLASQVWSLAGTSRNAAPAAMGLSPGDVEAQKGKVRALAGQLTKPNRELAYVIAYILTIADLDIAPAEDAFVEDLRAALWIEEDRADALNAAIGDALNPES